MALGPFASMGPRSRDRGILRILTLRAYAETASMGPRSRDRGIASRGPPCAPASLASMGPRSRDRGIVVCDRFFELLAANASMGPRSRDRGILNDNSLLAVALLLQWGRGHVTAESRVTAEQETRIMKLQWGRGHVTAESLRCEYGSPSMTWLQWGRGHVTAESSERLERRPDGGRASMGPRSRDRGIVPVPVPSEGHAPASMGPRSRDRGILAHAACSLWPALSFNGAAVT